MVLTLYSSGLPNRLTSNDLFQSVYKAIFIINELILPYNKVIKDYFLFKGENFYKKNISKIFSFVLYWNFRQLFQICETSERLGQKKKLSIKFYENSKQENKCGNSKIILN